MGWAASASQHGDRVMDPARIRSRDADHVRVARAGSGGSGASDPQYKSVRLGELASDLADIPFRVEPTIHPEWFAGKPCRTPGYGALGEMRARFDRNVTQAAEAVSGTDDARLKDPWSLSVAG